jgi:hypothetical protein
MEAINRLRIIADRLENRGGPCNVPVYVPPEDTPKKVRDLLEMILTKFLSEKLIQGDIWDEAARLHFLNFGNALEHLK